MPAEIKLKVNLKPLEELKKNFNSNLIVQVGVLGNKASRTDATNNNATIGATQELGSLTSNIPQRSFLKMPLELKGEELAEKTSKVIKNNLIKNNGIQMIMQQIGIVAEGIIDDAFETGGFGMWQPLKPKTIKAKGKSDILENTLQLRNSITSRVVKR